MFHIFLLLLLSSSICLASQTVYYDPETKKEVVDVSGQRKEKDVYKEFNLSKQTQEITLDENEGYKIKNGKLIKYDLLVERNKKRAEREKQLQQKKDAIKQKLNLTDQELEDLKEAVND